MTEHTSEFFDGIFNANSGYVEEVFARYTSNPLSVGADWRAYFDGFQDGLSTTDKTTVQLTENTLSNSDLTFEFGAASLVEAYRKFGYLQARTNPLPIAIPECAALKLEPVGLSSADLERTTGAGSLLGLPGRQTLKSLLAILDKDFCGSVGAEIEHVANPTERQWLRAEFAAISRSVPGATRKQIYAELAKADALEKTIATQFIGKKRFSIEGADAQIPAIETVIDVCAQGGTQEFSIAMAH